MKLKDYLESKGISAVRFAADMNVSYSTLCYWRNGQKHPSLEHMIEIEKLTNGEVTMKDFEPKKKLAPKPKKTL